MFNSRFYGFFILAVLIPNVQISSSTIADWAYVLWGSNGVPFPSNSKSFALLNSIQLLLKKSEEHELSDMEKTDDIMKDMETFLKLWDAGASDPELDAARKALRHSVLKGVGSKPLQAGLSIIRTLEISEVLADLTEPQIDSLMWLYLNTLNPTQAIVFLLKTVMYNNPSATPLRMSFRNMGVFLNKKEILDQVSAAIAKKYPELTSNGIRSCVDKYLNSSGQVYNECIPPGNSDGNVAVPAGVDTNIFVQDTTSLASIIAEEAAEVGFKPKSLTDEKILLILNAVGLVARRELEAAVCQTQPMNGFPVTEQELEILVEKACNDQNKKSVFEAFKGFGMQVMRVVVIDQLARYAAGPLSKIPAESCKEIVGTFIKNCDLKTAFLVIEEMSTKMVKKLIKRSTNMTHDLVKLAIPKSIDLFSLRKAATLIGKLRRPDFKPWVKFLEKVDRRIIPAIFGNCLADGSTES